MNHFFIFTFLIFVITQVFSKEKINKKEPKETIDKITQIPEPQTEEKSEIKLEKEQFQKQIEVFTLGEFTTFEIPESKGEYIYYYISNPCILTFAFYLSDIEKYISLFFYGPNDKKEQILLEKFEQKNFLFYEYKILNEGKYMFYLDNKENKENIEISFAVKDSWNMDENIGTKKLDKITEYLDEMDTKVNKIRLKQNIINKKNDAHNEVVMKHNKEILIYSCIEVGTMIIILVVQLYYIKNKISKI